MEKLKEMVVAFIGLGSLSVITIMYFLAENYATDGRVKFYIVASTLVGIFLSYLVLVLYFDGDLANRLHTTIVTLGISAFASNILMFHWNAEKKEFYKNAPAVIIEKGVEKSKRKQHNGGGYFKMRTRYGTYDVQVPRAFYENYAVGDTLSVDIEIGNLQFVKIEL